MSSSDGPVIVLVQGSFQKPMVYQKLCEELEAQGFVVKQPALPSCGEDPSVSKVTLTDDANSVQEAVRDVVEQGKALFLVCHSYGGLVGSEAISEDLIYANRKAQSKSGGVIHVFFVAAFLLPVGQSVLGAFGESPNNDVKPDGRFIIKSAKQTLYHDLPESEAEYYASHLIHQSYKVQETRLTRAAYLSLPCTYLVTDKDQACPPAYQEMFAKQADAKVEHCDTGHSPMLVQPAILARRIAEVASAAVTEL